LTAVSNSDFWNSPSVLLTQQSNAPWSHAYEDYLLDGARQRSELSGESIELVHVVGCGPGREIPIVRRMFPNAHIIASDVAQNMIEVCARNLQRWGCSGNIDLRCSPASRLRKEKGGAGLVVAFNNVLTYVSPKADRSKTLRALREVLRPGGLLIGVVHHRWGRLTKSGYFALQRLAWLVRLTAQEPGDRLGGFSGLRVPVHYYTTTELRFLLTSSGFVPLEVLSLDLWHRGQGRKYNPLRGDNNLMFAAVAY
jgi:SAM-dependent methyltransferase